MKKKKSIAAYFVLAAVLIGGCFLVASLSRGKEPVDIGTYVSESQEYLQKARETADSSYYEKIEELLEKADKVDPDNAAVRGLRASVALGRHKFKEAEEYAAQAIALDGHNGVYYGLRGDAEIELGLYKEAADSFQKMTDLRPDYNAYVRIAYIRELYGDIEGAKEALAMAISAGSSMAESVAFAHVELGKLHMRSDLALAKESFADALGLVDGYPPALEGLGKVAFFEGDLQAAEGYFLSAYGKLPIVQYATDLGDLYAKKGNVREAEKYYALSQVAFGQSEKGGVSTDLEESLFLSDHDLDLPEALERAKRAHEARPSIYAADYLAWALYKNGQADKAAAYEQEALRLGETDALILFHQGMIAAENGDMEKARRYLSQSVAANPHFSILEADTIINKLRSL